LAKFFILIRKYNNDNDIDPQLQDRIVQYFEYKWEFDENNAISLPEYEKILDQLPIELQLKLIEEFLFNGFLDQFKQFFCFKKWDSKIQHSFYTFEDYNYQ
jgi:hypothetical protein